MKSKRLMRIPAVVLTVALLFTAVFSMSVFVNAASFTPRTTAPDYSNKYYYSSLNIFYENGYGMPNCTAYAYGRAYEILGKKPNLSKWDADTWYSYNQNGGYYKYGSTPKLGAIACWGYYGGGGHVAVVERIENGVITFSNSEWGGRTFYTETASVSDPNAGGASWWYFQGYIYLIDSADVVPPTTQAPKTYATGIYKTEVDSSLNMRSGAGTSYGTLASIPNGVNLTVTKVQAAGGYTWGQTTYNGKNGWVALDFCQYISELPKETTAPTTVKPTTSPTTAAPTTVKPTTAPITAAPTTVPTTAAPTTVKPTTAPTQPTTAAPKTEPSETQVNGLGIGDINFDGVRNIVDATLIQKIVAGYPGFTEEQRSLCDFNFDGKISVADATCLQKYLAQTYQ